MSREGPFRTIHPPFATFLEQEGHGTGDSRFVARNFLLDENVLEARARTYGGYGAEDGFADAGSWVKAHKRYLKGEIFLKRPAAGGAPGILNPANKRFSPETFRQDDNFVTYGGAHKRQELLRVLSVAALADAIGADSARIAEAGRDLVRARVENRSPDAAREQFFTSVLDTWNSNCQLRPAFVTFYADHEDLFQARPADDVADWADELRDRLGLGHLDPSTYGELPILVFRYPVGTVPKSTLRKKLKPLAVPSILDGEMNPAFCPAPANQACGHTVHLAGAAGQLCREVVHPYLDLDTGHLFRVGTVKKNVPADLWPARKAHLVALRQTFGRDDYAATTDPED